MKNNLIKIFNKNARDAGDAINIFYRNNNISEVMKEFYKSNEEGNKLYRKLLENQSPRRINK